MTITTETNRVHHSGDGATTAFAFSYYVEDAADLEVWLRSADGETDTLQTIATHYTVSGEGSASVTVTFVTAPASGEKATIIRREPPTNETSVDNINSFRSQAIETQLDRFARQSQRSAELEERSLQLRETDDPPSAGEFDAKSRKIINVADGTADNDAVNKAQVTALTASDVAAAAASAAAAAASAASAAAEAGDAATAKTAAEAAQSAAETAKTAAETAETNAETAETNASVSAAAASASAAAAAASAADAGMNWRGNWATSTAYAVSDHVRGTGGSYICKLAHTSSAGDEPESGGSWSTYWDQVADDGIGGAAATETTAGIAEIATQVETDAGSDDTRFVTPAKLAGSALQTKVDGIEPSADVTDAVNVGSSIHGASAKTTPVDADTMPLIDSAAANVLKKVTWANIKATLKTYFDSLTTTLTNKTIALGSNTVSGTAAQFDTAVTDDNFLFDSDLGRVGFDIDAAALLPEDGAAGPTLATVAGTHHDYEELLFDGASTERAMFRFRAPEGCDESAAIRFRAAFAPKGTSSGNVRFSIALTAIGDGDTIDAAVGTAVAVDTAAGAVADVLQETGNIDVTPAGAWAAGDWIIGYIERLGGHANDTNTDDVGLQGLAVLPSYNALKDE